MITELIKNTTLQSTGKSIRDFRHGFNVFFFFVIVFCIPKSLQAQEKLNDSVFDTSSKTFLILPLVINNPVFDTGFGVMPMYFFKFNPEDTISPPSMVTAISLYSTNKSYVFLPSARFYWNEDKNRASVIGGPMRTNFDFIYEQDAAGDIQLVYSELKTFLLLEYSRKIIGDFYLGALYLGTKSTYKFDQGTEEQNEFAKEFFEQNGITDNFISSIGLNMSFDNRDYVYYPTKGLSFSVRPKLNREWLGSDNDYIDTDFNASYFIRMSSKGVLAFGFAGGIATGDVPFDGYQTYGVRNNLRGYPGGKYRGRNMMALQAEYRLNIYNRWGAVGFAGSGSIWGHDESGEETFERNWLPSAGIGARYMVSLVKRINIRLDYAIGVDGNQGLYFGIMEAF
jgi:outer membrane protein assembly factor BamA